MDISLSEAQEVGEKRNNLGEAYHDVREESLMKLTWNLIMSYLCL